MEEGYNFSSSVNPLTYMMDDDVESVSTSSWDDIQRIQQELYTWQPDFYSFQDEEGTYTSSNKDVYKNLYELIMACNIVNEYIDGSQRYRCRQRQLSVPKTFIACFLLFAAGESVCLSL